MFKLSSYFADHTGPRYLLLLSSLTCLAISLGMSGAQARAQVAEPRPITPKPWHESLALSPPPDRPHHEDPSPALTENAAPELILSSATLTLPMLSGIKAIWLKAAAAGGWAYLVKLIYTRLHHLHLGKLQHSLVHPIQPPDDESLEQLIKNHPAFLADETQNLLPHKPTDPMAPPYQLWPSEDDQPQLTATTPASHDLNTTPTISVRDAFKQMKLAARLHELQVAASALPSTVLMKRLAPYMSTTAAPTTAPDLLASFDAAFPSRLPELGGELSPSNISPAVQTQHMQLKYLLLSKFILKDHSHLSAYRATLMADLATLQSYAATIQDFLSTHLSRSGQRAATSSAPHHAHESLPSHASQSSDDNLTTLTALYTHLSPHPFQNRLQQLAGQLHGVAATTLYEHLRASLSTTGLKVFLITFLELKPTDYGLDAQTFASYHNLLKRLLSGLTPADLQDPSLHQLFQQTQWLWSQLTAEQLTQIASELAIPESHHQELLVILKDMAANLLTHPFKLGQYYLLSAKVFFNSSDGHGQNHEFKVTLQAVKTPENRRPLNAKLYFATAHLPKHFLTLRRLIEHQQLALTKYVNDELHYLSSDYRWQHNSYVHLKKRLDQFIATEAKTVHHQFKATLLFASLGIPVMDPTHLVELLAEHLTMSPAEINSHWELLRSRWQERDPTHSTIPHTYEQLHDRFNRLSYEDALAIQHAIFPTTLSPSMPHNFDFLTFLHKFFYEELTLRRMRHLFLSFVLKLEQPSRLTMNYYVQQYQNRTHQFSGPDELAYHFRKELRFLLLRFQDFFGQVRPSTSHSSSNFHAEMLRIYHNLTPQDFAVMMQKWGFTGEEHVEHFRRKLMEFTQDLLQHHPAKFDVFISRIMYLQPVSLYHAWSGSDVRKKYDVEKSMIAQFHRLLHNSPNSKGQE